MTMHNIDEADTNGVGALSTGENGAPVSVIVPADFAVVDTRSDLKKAHERLIQTLEEDIRSKAPINAEQFITYNPIGGVFMPTTDQEKQEAVNVIANSAPTLITLMFKKHWVTTALGVVAIVPQILVASGVDLGAWSGIVSAIASGVGLVFSKSIR